MNIWGLFMTLSSWIGVELEPSAREAVIKPRPYTIIVEGNVASGKSTLLSMLQDFEGFETVPEPVSKWQNVSGTNMLEKMINDGDRWLATFELYASKTRLENVLTKGLDAKYRVMERSLYSEQYCFNQILKDEQKMSEGEFAVLNRWFKTLMNYDGLDLGVDLIIYVRTDPDILEKRIQKRGRKEETESKDSVSIEFLRKLHKYHEDWLIHHKHPVPAKVLVVDGNDEDARVTEREVMMGLNDIIPGIHFQRKQKPAISN
eukprot:TRINITY_DN12623_c0_g1_i1.p1 TRINITY_DN12623_c0_g1~~TRINITY_DN12623_c0_g1_i1.p1  ORF type:complete len:260 (-),score=57.19 TRINITY_DN12623_c0_g1_i1:223-1002(-)